jgi:CheY-like chemotaxis protein
MTWLAGSTMNPIRILLVEDDDGDARAVERTFVKARIANPVERAIDGVEALDILRGTHGRAKMQRPFLLLVDLNMPRSNGLQLIKTIREDADLHDAVIFVLTTSNREEDKESAHAMNVTGYILKENAGQDFLRLFTLVDSYWRIVEMP